MKQSYYSIEEIVGMLMGKAEQQPPFHGRTIQVWQGGKIVLWEEGSTKKPEGTTQAKLGVPDALDKRTD